MGTKMTLVHVFLHFVCQSSSRVSPVCMCEFPTVYLSEHIMGPFTSPPPPPPASLENIQANNIKYFTSWPVSPRANKHRILQKLMSPALKYVIIWVSADSNFKIIISLQFHPTGRLLWARTGRVGAEPHSCSPVIDWSLVGVNCFWAKEKRSSQSKVWSEWKCNKTSNIGSHTYINMAPPVLALGSNR